MQNSEGAASSSSSVHTAPTPAEAGGELHQRALEVAFGLALTEAEAAAAALANAEDMPQRTRAALEAVLEIVESEEERKKIQDLVHQSQAMAEEAARLMGQAIMMLHPSRGGRPQSQQTQGQQQRPERAAANKAFGSALADLRDCLVFRASAVVLGKEKDDVKQCLAGLCGIQDQALISKLLNAWRHVYDLPRQAEHVGDASSVAALPAEVGPQHGRGETKLPNGTAGSSSTGSPQTLGPIQPGLRTPQGLPLQTVSSSSAVFDEELIAIGGLGHGLGSFSFQSLQNDSVSSNMNNQGWSTSRSPFLVDSPVDAPLSHPPAGLSRVPNPWGPPGR